MPVFILRNSAQTTPSPLKILGPPFEKVSHHVTLIWQAQQKPHLPKSSQNVTFSTPTPPQQQLSVVLPRNLVYTT